MHQKRDVSKSFFRCSNFECCLTVLKPNDSLTLFGVFTFRVLHGEVCVRGRMLSSTEKGPVHVNAPYLLGPPINIHAGPKVDRAQELPRLARRVRKLAEDPEEVLGNLEGSDTLLQFWFKENNTASLMAGLYGPVFFTPPCGNSDWNGHKLSAFCSVLNAFSYPPLFGEGFASYIDELVNGVCSKRGKGKKPIVVITGPKGVGKSTLARSLVSMLYEKDGRPIYLLDGDVGQSECTPSGCISLCKLESPMFNASFSSQ